jgi:hypothetical protein
VSPSLALVPEPFGSLRPDISWIKKHVSVLRVGKALDMRIRGSRAKCWRPENHAHGDSNPSLRFYERGNRVRCFVCDIKGGHSCVDLVMGVLGIDVGSAVRWIAERFTVPNIKPGAPLGRRTKVPAPYRVGLPGCELEVLVRSGMFGQLKPAERCILVTLSNFKDPDTGITCLSYQAIMRYAGVASRANVSNALKKLQKLHAIQINQGKWVGATRQCSSYRVTLEDPKFLELCNSVQASARADIAKERIYRAEMRASRERKNKARAGGLHPPGPLLVPSNPIQKPETLKQETYTCEGLDLSSLGELNSTKSVLGGNGEIGVSGEISSSEALRRRLLQMQAEEIKAKFSVKP